MSRANQKNPDVIRRERVRVVTQPAILGCGDDADGGATAPMAIVPLLDGDRVAGFEVRCGCGSSAIVECVYEDTPTEEAQ